MSENNNLSINQLYNNLIIIWFGLFSSQFVFLVVIYFIQPTLFEFDFSKPVLDQNAALVIGFLMVGVMNVAISLLLKKKFLDQSVAEQNPAFVQTAMIVGCALCEVASLLGFMLAFIAEYQYFFIWFVIGMVGMLLHIPLRKSLMNASFKKEL